MVVADGQDSGTSVSMAKISQDWIQPHDHADNEQQ